MTTPILTQVTTFSVTGFSVRTKNSQEFEPKTAKIPELWSTFRTSGLATPEGQVFGVYSEYETDANGYYTLMAGVKGSFTGEQLHTVMVPAGNYLVFKAKGPMPKTLIETWQFVWHYFESSTDHQRLFKTDFEAYLSAEEVDIYIGVK